jgi:hypothetical protein
MASKIMGYRPILLPASCDAGKNCRCPKLQQVLSVECSNVEVGGAVC